MDQLGRLPLRVYSIDKYAFQKKTFWLLVGVQATFQAAFQAAYAKSASACASRDESGSVGIILARDDREAAGVLRQHARDL